MTLMMSSGKSVLQTGAWFLKDVGVYQAGEVFPNFVEMQYKITGFNLFSVNKVKQL